jgi:NitT/TauT family transport system permease protein
MTLFGYRIPAFVAILLWCVVWEVVGRSEALFVFPPITGVFSALFVIVQQNMFHNAAIESLKAVAYGMALSITCGVSLGFLMGRFEAMNRLFGMWVNIFVSAPLSALVPVIMLLCGLGRLTIIITVFLFAVWIITLDTLAGVKHISPSLIEMGRSFGASRFQMLTKILFWAALPEILAGIRMGLIRAVKGVVVGQLLVAVVDFGLMFDTYSRNFRLEEFWALTFVLFAFALGLSSLVGMVEQRLEYYAGTR